MTDPLPHTPYSASQVIQDTFFALTFVMADKAVAVQVLLLDEVTVDMDVVARLDLLDFFRCSPLPPAVLCMLSHAVLRFAASSYMKSCLLS